MPLRNLAWLLAVPAMVALGLAISYSAPAPDKDYQRVRKVVDVMAEVDANFYRKLTDDEWKQFVEAMINGGLHKLDPHSEYLNAEQLTRFESESQGSFGGVGIQLDVDPSTKFLKVGHPVPGTPAYEAGVVAGDLIVKVGDQPTDQLKFDTLSPDQLKFPEREKQIAAARKLITGEPGTPVTLTLRRAGRNPPDQEVALTRAAIPQHPIAGYRRRTDDPARWDWFVDKPNGVAYIRLGGREIGFNDLTTKELRAAVEEIERDGGKALIIDLRDNGGGLLNQAIDVCSTFLPDGKPIVSTRGRDPGKTRDFTAKKDAEMFRPADRRPVVILVNDQSASASEIVASALQDHHRATIVGERTYGKGSVQKLLRLGGQGDQKAAVKLTTETYWRPSGKNMDRKLAEKDGSSEWGVTPDVEVKTTDEEKARAELDRYRREWVAGKPSVVGPNPPAPPDPQIRKGPDGKPVIDITKPFTDRVLDTAVDVLKKKLKEVGAAPPAPERAIPAPVFG